MFWKKFNAGWWPQILLLAAIAGLVYLPRVGALAYSQLDDWYFIYDGLVLGPKAFIDIALHTRPIRGPLYELYFSLFGLHPLPYHLTLYFWRVLGGLGALWLFNLLWPRQRHANFFMALLFLIFPGLSWWVAGFAFQPYVLSLCLQVFSIAFTLQAMRSASVTSRIAWALAAIISGWIYLALVEFAIGMELFRVLCVYWVIRRDGRELAPRSAALQTLRASAPFFVIPIGFVFWYQFLFENWRKAQDAGTQLARVLDSPLAGLWWLVRLLQGTLNVALLAWGVPFYENFFAQRLGDILLGIGIAAVVLVLVVLAGRQITTGPAAGGAEGGGTVSEAWQPAAVWIGLLGTIGGVLPIVLANRTATFGGFSHYTLPASLAGAVFLGGLVYSISSDQIRLFALCVLTGIASLTHFALATQAAVEERAMSNFWWQVSWRAPAIQRNTMLVVDYPDIPILTGNEFIWGPANFIYYPEKQAGSPVTVALAAAPLQPDTLISILTGAQAVQKTDEVITDTTMNFNFQNILVLSQPSAGACVHAVDSRWPGISVDDGPMTVVAAAKSKIANIIPASKPAAPLEVIFGPEPARDWCYYFEQADLARQRGDWAAAAGLGDQVLKLGLRPNDQIEWMPFVQAFAVRGDAKQVRDLSKLINTQPAYKSQACQILTGMAQNGYPLTPAMDTQVRQLFCPGGS